MLKSKAMKPALACLLILAGGLMAAALSHRGRGVIRQVKEGGRILLIEHERIPGFMPAMTMDFALADPALAQGFQAGDAVDFTLTQKGNFWPITRLSRRPKAGKARRRAELAPVTKAAHD